ncbi:MAG: tyrosine-type recombinase/integrase [Kiloniellaceae bacterium]
MPRKIASPALDTRTARLKLKRRRAPYWVRIEKGLYLGYRTSLHSGQGAKVGHWQGRFRDQRGKQHYCALGAADDVSDADGSSTRSFDQAQGKLREWRNDITNQRRRTKTGPYTVADAMADYIEAMKQDGKASAYDAEKRAEAVILPDLGNIAAADLTTADIKHWRDRLARAPGRLRTGKLSKTQNYRAAPETEEDKRRRKSTANRTLTVLKAALNHAFNEGEVASDVEWRRVKPFQGVDAARQRFLSLEEAKRLMEAADKDIGRLIRGALLTGARYGELRSMRVRDFSGNQGTVLVAKGKDLRPRHVILTDEGISFFRSITRDRQANEYMFLRAGNQWGPSHQARPFAEACKNAELDGEVTFHGLRHTYASLAIMSGMSPKVLADNLSHADTRMVEKHYGHLADQYRIRMVRETAPQYGV